MRVVLAGVGTRGDFQPLLALAVALQRRGHEAVMYGARDFAPWAAREAVAFENAYLVTSDMMRPVTASAMRGALDRLDTAKRLRFELEIQFERLSRLAASSDVVLGMGYCPAARSAAELAGVPFHWVLYTPQNIPSADHPPPLPIRDRRWLNPLLHELALYFLRQSSGRHLAELRARRGLPTRHDIMDLLMGTEDVLLAVDPEIAPVPSDARLSCVQLGAFVHADHAQPPPDLEAFLHEGDEPLYVGFGSMADEDPAQMVGMVERITSNLGVRAIVSLANAEVASRAPRSSKRVHVTGAVSHAPLLPRVSLAVHHGGSGTTATIIRAGVPQVVVPHLYDQYYFADRMHRHGVAPRPFPRRALTEKRLRAAVKSILDNPEFRSCARVLARSVQDRNGVAAAVEYLEARYGAGRNTAPTQVAREPFVSDGPR